MQIVKPRPVQAASIPGMLGMFQIVRVSGPSIPDFFAKAFL